MKSSLFAALILAPGALLWEESAKMPLPRAGYMAGAVSSRLLLAGGSYWADGKKHWSNRADFFDPGANQWSPAAPLPDERSDAASVSVNHVLYLFGGGAGNTVRRDALAFESGRWRAIPEAMLPSPRLYAVAASLGTRIYLSGGIKEAGKYESAVNDFLVWDTAKPKSGWQALPPLPGRARFVHASAGYQGKIYVFGGATAGPADVANLGDAYVFDPATKQWTTLPDLPHKRRAWGAAELGGLLYLLGGYTNTYETEVYRFDSTSGKLGPAGALPHPYCAAIFVNVNGSIVVAGGETADGVRPPWTLIGTARGQR
jgi:N-acetylneuraminic acid mutarotase